MGYCSLRSCCLGRVEWRGYFAWSSMTPGLFSFPRVGGSVLVGCLWTYPHSPPTQNPPRGETTTVPALYPATRNIPATLHVQDNTNAGNNNPHRIRTTHPTIQNYYLTKTSITYVFIIYCTYTDIRSRYNTA